MTFERETEIFIRDYVKDINEGNAAVFAGAGLSIPAGYVNWAELLSEIAYDLGLDIDKESDLVSLAQFHVNENRTKSKVCRKILEEFVECTEVTENHKILSRLPISSVWTTNYDDLLERSFLSEGKNPDIKHNIKQLLTNKPKRDVVIYKMHGDVSCPTDAIITKEQYERYHQTHEPFINALTGELTTKTFLFLGFSFTDPNLDYVLSRLNFRYSEDKKQHYCITKKPILGDAQNKDQASLDYNTRKQELIINDLKRYGIKTLLINDYSEITAILKEIEFRFKKKTIFVSGSAEVYSPYQKQDAIEFIHKLSRTLIENDYRIINGFGWGVGSSIINGALEAIYNKPLRYSESQLVLRPFPQFKTGNKDLQVLWSEYRENMISLAGISIFIFGNKIKDDVVVSADGMVKEFEISHSNGNICIPIAATEHASRFIYDKIISSIDNYYSNPNEAKEYLEKLADSNTSINSKIRILIEFIKKLTQ
ncbi:SIR2 family protein [Aeromonas salmonicida]|uniref:SIR2 family protein n=1 Tax=Aeromonas salmonicida TaxID=645 RepID=UPI003AE27C7E